MQLAKSLSGSESPKKPPTATPSPRKAKLPVSTSRAARDEAGTGVVAPKPQTQPHTPKKVSISESAEEEHPAIVKPRPDTPMPDRQTRKTPSVAQLRASFEGAGHGSPAGTSSIKPAQEHTPSPRKDTSVHRQDWAVKDATSSRGSQHIIEKRSIGCISQEVTPSHIKPHFSGTGTNRSFALQVTAEGYATTATLVSDSSSAPQRTPHPKTDHRGSSRGQILKRASATEDTSPSPYYQSSSVVHPSLVHPLLRQTKSMGTGLHEQRTLKHAANARSSVPGEELLPIPSQPGSKVSGLRERYDRASVSAPFLPFRRRDERRLASPTTSLVALSAAIGLATFPGDTPYPLGTTPPSSGRSHHPTIGAADADKKAHHHHHHHPSPLRDRISIFETLATPAAKSRSSGGVSKAATALRRASGGAGAGLRTVAETGSRVWQRLSSSGSSDEKEAGSSSSGDGRGQHARKKERKGKGKKQKKKEKKERMAGRAAGFEPRRNMRPCAPGESTFLVQGTISRVPIGVVMAMGQRRQQQQQQPDAGDARGAQPPSLPDLDFEVDGAAADMVGYFAHEFDISFSLAGGGATSSSSGGDATGRSGGEGSSSSNSSSDRDGIGPVETESSAAAAAALYRNPTVVAKSRASPVLSVHSARGTAVARPAIPPRNPARGRRIAHDGETSQQRRAWRQPTPAPARNKYGGFCDNRPVRPVVGTASPVSEGDGDEDMIVSSAQCGLAHPRPSRPSRVLDVKRFVAYCRETARGRSAARVMGKL